MTPINRRDLLSGAGLLAGAAVSSSALARAGAAQGDEPELPGRTSHTKFAVNIEAWFGKLALPDRVRGAAALGFPAIEFWPWHGKDLDALEAALHETDTAVAQFTAWGFSPGLNDPANHNAFVKEIAASCAVAKRFACEKMCVVAGNDITGVSNAEMLDAVTRGLKLAKPVVEDAGVMLILEPMNGRVDHPGHCLYGSPDAVRICREVDSPMVKINWDLYHMQISEGDLCGHLREGFDQVGYLQVADHPGRREPGTGEIHYNRVLREAHELGYRGYVGLECWPSEDERTAALRVHAADQW
ncbi:MAG: TIM barrel protein [Planctomycetes bacterium]|nr:TIM barrel protein [Planctomycetota bacterium]MCB9906012.1 TIM barrel protein [Planctomycetota bacterium]